MNQWLLLTLLMTAVPVCTLAAQEDDSSLFGLGWLDQTREFSTNRADALAQQLDRFFGLPRSDLEAAYSSLRLITENRWQEGKGNDIGLRLRGTIHLPAIHERLSLILSEDKGEGSAYYQQQALLNESRTTRLNLEYKLGEDDKHRFDFRIGLRSSLKLRTSFRYRYEAPLSETWLHRYSQSLYFIDGKGFGSFAQYQMDLDQGNNRLLRWSTELRVEESFKGLDWASSLQELWRLSDTAGISLYGRLAGNSEASYIAQYQLGLRLRGNVARPWLFWELSPGYVWEKASRDLPRQGAPFLIMRLEMGIGRL